MLATWCAITELVPQKMQNQITRSIHPWTLVKNQVKLSTNQVTLIMTTPKGIRTGNLKPIPSYSFHAKHGSAFKPITLFNWTCWYRILFNRKASWRTSFMDSLHEVNKGARALQIVIYIMVIVDKDLSHITRVLQLVMGQYWWMTVPFVQCGLVGQCLSPLDTKKQIEFMEEISKQKSSWSKV